MNATTASCIFNVIDELRFTSEQQMIDAISVELQLVNSSMLQVQWYLIQLTLGSKQWDRVTTWDDMIRYGASQNATSILVTAVHGQGDTVHAVCFPILNCNTEPIELSLSNMSL